MANYNLTNQPISASFQQLLQKNDSDFLVDGTGSLIQSLKVTGSISSSTYYGDGSNLTGISAGAVATGSLLKTASFDNGTRNMTFTKGDSSTFDVNIPGGTVDTGSLIETASIADATITFTKADASQFSIEVDNVTSSLETQDVFVNVKNVSGGPLGKGTAVHATGVTGENVNVIAADSSISANMPAFGLLNEALSNNATGQAIISGKIKNIDTTGLTAGASVYVNGNGTLSATKPTGSDLIQNIGIAGKINATEGELIVQGGGRSNDVPNIPQGQIWVGNVNGVATPTSTGSFAKIDENNTFTGTQNFNNISVSGTGSFGYIQSVTGSAKVIGDAFLILNNDTPTERYAGIKVQDSGSTQDTASLQWDGQEHDWFYEFSSSAAHEYGVVLMGPEYTTKGTPTYNTSNTITKGTGGHHLVDSNITDDGTTVSITGDLSVSGAYKGFDSSSFAILNQANTFTAGPQVVSGSNGYVKQQFTAPGTNQEKAFFEIDGATNNGNSYNRVFYGIADYPSFGTRFEDYFAIEYYDGFGYNFGSEFNLNGVTTALLTKPSGSTNQDYARLETKDDGDGTSTANIQANTINIGVGGNVNNIEIGKIDNSSTVGAAGVWNYAASGSVNFYGDTTYFGPHIVSASTTFGFGYDTIFNGRAIFNQEMQNNLYMIGNGYISSSNYISASAFIGDGSQLTGVAGGIFTQTGSYYSTTNDLEVTGSFNVQGGIGGNHQDLTIVSNTASIDLTTGNTFTVTLVSSADTHLDVSTFSGAGQSINVLVKQPAAGNTGSISFSPDFKFGQGYSYIPTAANSAEDIVSFTRFGNSLYGTYINNFS